MLTFRVHIVHRPQFAPHDGKFMNVLTYRVAEDLSSTRSTWTGDTINLEDWVTRRMKAGDVVLFDPDWGDVKIPQPDPL